MTLCISYDAMKDGRSYNRIAAIFFLLIGIFFALYARKVEIGTWTEPGPGFLPFWAGLTLTAHVDRPLLGKLREEGCASEVLFLSPTRFLEKGSGNLSFPGRL